MPNKLLETEENQDNTPLDIDYHTAIDGEGGYVDGYIETIEETDSSAIDIDYHTAVDSEAGHVEDTPSPLRNQIQLTLKNRHMKIQNITLMLLNMKRIQTQVVAK